MGPDEAQPSGDLSTQAGINVSVPVGKVRFVSGLAFTGCGENPMLHLILGGAAVPLCDNCISD
jgi:hypothetical protein